jgi:two-component system, OmpR family, sensor histidine kinase VicK
LPFSGHFDNSNVIDSRAILDEVDHSEPTKIISDPNEIKFTYFSLLGSAQDEILLLLPTTKAFYREENSGIIDKIGKAARDGIRVRILAPSNPKITDMVMHQSDWDRKDQEIIFNRIEHREISALSTKTNVIAVISDRNTVLAIELKDDPRAELIDSIGSAMLSQSKPTVLSYISFFDALWNESDAREKLERKTAELQISIAKEEKSRSQAELLQDVLTHDIRNHVQIAMLSADFLEKDLDSEKYKKAFTDLRVALEGTVSLLERVKQLGKILSSFEKPSLYPVNLSSAIEKAIILVDKGNAGRTPQISVWYEDDVLNNAKVIADNFLDEAFVNLFSNSVKFTEIGINPTIEIRVSRPDSGATRMSIQQGFVKVSISDNAKGISESMRKDIFTRYLKNASGSGLGMSIVHALIVDRYGGKILLNNRIESDYTMGTTVSLILLLA